MSTPALARSRRSGRLLKPVLPLSSSFKTTKSASSTSRKVKAADASVNGELVSPVKDVSLKNTIYRKAGQGKADTLPAFLLPSQPEAPAPAPLDTPLDPAVEKCLELYKRCASGLIDSLDSHGLLDLADECISKFGFRNEDLEHLTAHLCYMDASLSSAMTYTPPTTPVHPHYDPLCLPLARPAADCPARLRNSTASPLYPPTLYPVPNSFAQLVTPEKCQKQDRLGGHANEEEHWSTWSYPSPAFDLAPCGNGTTPATPKLYSKMSIASLLSPTR